MNILEIRKAIGEQPSTIEVKTTVREKTTYIEKISTIEHRPFPLKDRIHYDTRRREAHIHRIEDCTFLFTSDSIIVVFEMPNIRRLEQVSWELVKKDIVRAHTRNFVIPYSDILRVEMREREKSDDLDVIVHIDVVTVTRRHEFHIVGFRDKKQRIDESVDIVRSFLPDKLHLSARLD